VIIDWEQVVREQHKMAQEKTNNPLVSVCIPTYNYARYLPKAIASCLRQSYKHIELIIVDDASTDNSRQVVESFADSRIRFSVNPVRLGLVENLNETLSLARGQFVKFLFADDYFSAETAIEHTVAAFSNQGVDLVFCSRIAIDAHGKQTYKYRPYSESRRLSGQEEAKRCLKRGNHIGGPTCVAVRSDALARVGEFDTTLRFQPDQEMWIRILLDGDAYFLAQPLVSVREHEGSETTRLVRAGQIQEETKKLFACCLRNKRIRCLFAEEEIREMLEQNVHPAPPESPCDVKPQPDEVALAAKTLRRLKQLVPLMLKKPVRNALNHYNNIHGSKQCEVKPPLFDNDVNHKVSYSQCGEDLILSYIFDQLKLSELTYLDIGAYDPFHFSNTYRFYRQGHHGVCVEPDPVQFARIRRERPRDTCLNAGIGGVAYVRHADYYRMSAPTLNTFSREEATRYESYGTYKIEEVIQLPLIPINLVLEKHFPRRPNLVSLDVEGLDLEIVQSFDFSRFRPEMFCVETLTYTEDNSERKIPEIAELMQSNGYFVYADTYINTIFVDSAAWQNR